MAINPKKRNVPRKNMKRISLKAFLKTRQCKFVIALLLSFAFMFTALSTVAIAQQNQLTLADILIALRSKKATLPERNKILTEAVNARGITFSLSAEIEKELSVTGADKDLIDSIRQKSQIVKIAAVVPPVETKPKADPVPAPPDFSFYEKRGDASILKGDFDAAVIDYTKAIEMNAEAVTSLLGRGVAYYNKKWYDLAIADYNKVIELNPKSSAAFANRGEAYEKKGNSDLAAADYKKALDLDPANESAKTNSTRLQAEQAKAMQKPEPIVPAPTTVPVIPEFVSLGQLTESSAIRMVKPIYSPIALKSNIGGKVIVDVEIDTEGNVTSAKTVSGHQFLRQNSEDAARKSKFKPAMVGNQAVKAKGFIVYNFAARQ